MELFLLNNRLLNSTLIDGGFENVKCYVMFLNRIFALPSVCIVNKQLCCYWIFSFYLKRHFTEVLLLGHILTQEVCFDHFGGEIHF